MVDPGPVAQAPTGPLIQALAQERFVASFISQSYRSQLTILPTVALVAGAWYQSTGSRWALAWLALGLGLGAWRYRFTERSISSAGPQGSTRRILHLLLVSGIVQALPLLAFAAMDDAARSILTLVLMTLATASVGTTSGFRSVFMAYAAPMLLPLAAAWVVQGWLKQNTAVAGLGVLVALYLWFLYRTGQHASAALLESCTYRFGQQQLNQELQRALDEADAANRAKTQFLAAASHDLRQPIHSMNVLVAALSLRPLDGTAREIVSLLGSVNQILSKQLDTLLDVSKLDAGVVQADLAVHRLDLIAKAHHAATAPLAAQADRRFELSAPAAVWVRTDAALLSRALSNLTDNALKYTRPGGLVKLHVAVHGTEAVLSVADDGIGIAASEQERVFGEFYQVGNVERDRHMGLGLGLSIVRRLCTLLAIELQLHSALGVGTTVTLRLPLVAPGAAPGAARLAADSPQGVRVLVIDDEAMVRNSMRLLLAGLGCQVHLAEGVRDAATLAAEHPLDLVLSDLRLRSGDSGLAAIEAVRQHQPEVPAVLITGDTAPDRIREAKGAGVPLLFKPVTLEDLIAVLPGGGNDNTNPAG